MKMKKRSVQYSDKMYSNDECNWYELAVTDTC